MPARGDRQPAARADQGVPGQGAVGSDRWSRRAGRAGRAGRSRGLSAAGGTRVAAVTATTPRLLLVDGHSLAYRAFFALPVENFSTTTGQPTNAVYGFTSMLINVLRDEQPTHIVVAFDVSRRSFRTEQYAEYKAGRSETPTDFKGQVSLVKEVLAALRIPVVEKEGYEADDVIATLACQARDAGHGGADLHRRPGRVPAGRRPTSPCSTRKRASPTWPGWTRPRSTAKYGVGPEHYRDLAALVGETSDNLPGVPGRRPEDRRQVDQPVRRLRGRRRPRRRDQGQGRRQPARAPRRRAAQLRAQPPGRRPRAAAAPGGRPLARAGTARRCTRSSTRCSSGSCATGSTSTWRRSSRRPRPASTSTGEVLRHRRAWPAWLDRARPGRRPGRAWRSPARFGRRHRRRSPASALATADGAGRLVRPGRARRRPTRPRWPAGWPTRAGPRCCTTQAGAAGLRRARLGAARAGHATPRSPPTWPAPTSAPTT